MTSTSRIEVLPYPEDETIIQALEDAHPPLVCRVWEQPELCVVMGKGGRVEQEVVEDHILAENVPLYRREGGGGTVVLSPGMLVIAVAAQVNKPFGNKRYFRMIQTPIQETLAQVGLPGSVQCGLSDIAFAGRKLLGSSLRRKGALLLYQSVLLVRAERALFSRYLQHPPREPDYRAGRPHESFTVTLEELGLGVEPSHLAGLLQESLAERLPQLFVEDLQPLEASSTSQSKPLSL